MLLVGFNFALHLIRKDSKAGVLYMLGSSALIIASALAVILLKLAVIVVVLGAVVLGALFLAPKSTPALLEEGGEGNNND